MNRNGRLILFHILTTADRTGLFIDGGYLDHMPNHGFPGFINYRKFIPEITANYGNLEKGFYYTCMPWLSSKPTEDERTAYAKQQKLTSHISKIPGMTVRPGKLQKHKNRFVQKRVDVLFALDLAKLSWKDEIDTAVLIAGDSDFVPAIDEATECGVKTVLYYYQPSYNRDLLQSVTESHEITLEMYQNFVRYR